MKEIAFEGRRSELSGARLKHGHIILWGQLP